MSVPNFTAAVAEICAAAEKATGDNRTAKLTGLFLATAHVARELGYTVDDCAGALVIALAEVDHRNRRAS